MAAGVSIMVLEFRISAEHLREGKILAMFHLSGSALVRCAGVELERGAVRIQIIFL